MPESSGSGWVWDTKGHIVTNNHVVEGADQLNVTFADGVVAPAQVVGTDAGSDLAVIQVDPSVVDLVPAEQGQIADVKVGGRAIAIGNPFGLVGTMTTGIVSAIGRSLNSDPQNSTSFNIPQVIQTDAAINPGNSGGPLLNESGQVIGVNFQIRSDSGASTGVGFAIPINIVQRVVPALISKGSYQHAYMGIRGQTYSPAWAGDLGLPTNARGAYVIDVVDGGPASRGGLRGAAAGDTNIALGVDQGGHRLPSRGRRPDHGCGRTAYPAVRRPARLSGEQQGARRQGHVDRVALGGQRSEGSRDARGAAYCVLTTWMSRHACAARRCRLPRRTVLAEAGHAG